MKSILFYNIELVLQQLKTAITDLPDNVYSTKSELLGASIGEHTRHTVELYLCVINEYENGVVNYDNRERKIETQTNKFAAIQTIDFVLNQIYKPNRKLILQTCPEGEEFLTLETNYFRELYYNFEHTIHHMAMIKIAVNELCDCVLEDTFGVAPSTIQYRKQCVQ